jgi:outer membrane protein W
VGITDKLKLRFGVGLDAMGLFGEQNKESVDYSISGISWGVGGDIGLKYEITDIFFVNAGLVFLYNFLQYADVNSSSDGKKTWTEISSDWTKIIQYLVLNLI